MNSRIGLGAASSRLPSVARICQPHIQFYAATVKHAVGTSLPGFFLLQPTWSGTVSLATSIAYWCGMAADVAIVVLLLRAGPVTGVSHSLMKGLYRERLLYCADCVDHARSIRPSSRRCRVLQYESDRQSLRVCYLPGSISNAPQRGEMGTCCPASGADSSSQL